jgi:dipeptidyl aminopeptidase/acylaminoacyl peptidase
MHVELVRVTTTDRLRLSGYLRTPAASVQHSLPVDLVLCLHGVGGNFYNPSFFDKMGDELLARGCAILRVNTRGHDEAYLDGGRQLGSAYEIVDDCRLDVTAWMDFATERGFRAMALWGHSLGAVKTVYFLGVQDDPRIVCALASSPPRFSNATYRASSDGPRFETDIARAQQLLADGQPEVLLETRVPMERRFAARTYLDKYGPNTRYDYFQHLPNVRKPLLLTVGSLEADNVSFAPLVEQGPSFETRWPEISFSNIDGANHAYASRTRELWTDVASWFSRAASPVGAR